MRLLRPYTFFIPKWDLEGPSATPAGAVGVTYARAGSDGGCEPPRPTYDRLGVIAGRSAILLSGTVAIALLMGEPASPISINDQVAAAAGGIANYYDGSNQFPNVVSLFRGGSLCTGSFINPRTILTAIASDT
jgi:hypothetical protein